MAIILTEGGIIPLDAHTYDLLHAYTAEHNAWLATKPNGDDCPYPPVQIHHEDMARHILARYLQDWAVESRKRNAP